MHRLLVERTIERKEIGGSDTMNQINHKMLKDILLLCRREYILNRIECADFEYWLSPFYASKGGQVIGSFNWNGSNSFGLSVLSNRQYAYIYIYGKPYVKRGVQNEGVLGVFLSQHFGGESITRDFWGSDSYGTVKDICRYNSSANVIGMFDSNYECTDCLTQQVVNPVIWCAGLAKFLDLNAREFDKRIGLTGQKEYRPDLRERVWAGATVDAALVRDFWEGRGEFTEVMAERVRQACKLADWPCTL